MRRVQFYVSDEQYAMIDFQAAAKCLTVSDYAGMAVFSHIDKYATRGIMAEMVKLYGTGRPSPVQPTFLGSSGKPVD